MTQETRRCWSNTAVSSLIEPCWNLPVWMCRRAQPLSLATPSGRSLCKGGRICLGDLPLCSVTEAGEIQVNQVCHGAGCVWILVVHFLSSDPEVIGLSFRFKVVPEERGAEDFRSHQE